MRKSEVIHKQESQPEMLNNHKHNNDRKGMKQ